MRLSLLVGILVVLIKLAGMLLSRSLSVMAEALQSSVDILVTLVLLHSVKVSAMPPDEDHPYGHGKAEVLASAWQMILIMVSAGWILFSVVSRIHEPEDIQTQAGLATLVLTGVIDLCMIFFLKSVYRATQSPAVLSEMLHLRSDLLASLGVILGLILVWATGIQLLDPIAGVLLMLYVVINAVFHLREHIQALMDGAMPSKELEELRLVLDEIPEVLGYHDVRTRMVGNTRVIELHALFDDNLSFVHAHEIAEKVEDRIRDAFPGCRVSLHYEPYEAENRHRAEKHRVQF